MVSQTRRRLEAGEIQRHSRTRTYPLGNVQHPKRFRKCRRVLPRYFREQRLAEPRDTRPHHVSQGYQRPIRLPRNRVRLTVFRLRLRR